MNAAARERALGLPMARLVDNRPTSPATVQTAVLLLASLLPPASRTAFAPVRGRIHPRERSGRSHFATLQTAR